MQKLGKNLGSYLGETIEIQSVLRDIENAARKNHWTLETFHETGDCKLFGLHRKAGLKAQRSKRKIYLSAGIHGDEPASPLAALRLLQENRWPEHMELWMCPCLNPVGFKLNSRANPKGIDLNRGYLNPVADEILAHISWLERQPQFDLCLMLHEDWESHGFYLYEQNPDGKKSFAEKMVAAVEKVCPIDRSELIEGRPAKDGIVRPNILPKDRPDWPEAFYMITHKTRQSYTLEAPSDFPLPARVNALVAAVRAAVEGMTTLD
ncbi:MAG TPA: M14 family metallocarboxypeptidase [Verrucomicrobiae bacterium]|nr:M14 family metallocarboxypeptidase [Verrucomicrobiae bacterium]